MIWNDKAQYEGEWKDNQAWGEGTFTHIDGDSYEGKWRKNKQNGYGIYKNMNGG